MADFEARVTVTLRWRDVDMLGHLNQSVYHELLEEARAALFTKLERIGHFPFVIARVELDYRKEVRRDHGHVEVVARPGAVGRSSLVVENDVLLPDGTVAAEGRSVLVAWDREARRSRPFTEEERAVLIELAGAPT
jgi:acyl-CoA thioester hydrolase